MNRYFVERFQDIRDALPSASAETLTALRQELNTLAAEIDARLDEVGQGRSSSPAQSNIHNLSSAANRP